MYAVSRGIAWWCRRNPTYLVSAGLMAVGARLYLVSPSTRAGDIGIILLTLGVLQAYEWTVGGIVVALHRWGRSPEDKPSLLWVAALFWTGPLAATTEMTAHAPGLGLILGVAACVVAMIEFWTLHRVLQLRFSPFSSLVACGVVILLAIAPPVLRVPEAVNGTNEVFLYLSWWLVAAIALMGVGIARFHAVHLRFEPDYDDATESAISEVLLFCLLIAALAAHLVGMNYGFFGHARLFYAAPLVAVLSVVGFELLKTWQQETASLMVLPALAPLLAILASLESFDPHMPVEMLPVVLHKPMVTTLLLAGLAWWFGAWRHSDGVLLHMGSLSVGLAIYQSGVWNWGGSIAAGTGVEVPSVRLSQDTLALVLYALAGYFMLMGMIRRSREELLIGLATHLAALAMLVLGRVHGDVLIVLLVGGWSWLLGLHLYARRPSSLAICVPVGFLMLVTWGYEFNSELLWHARSHAVGMILILSLIALAGGRPIYRYTAGGCGVLHGLFYPAVAVASGEHAAATSVVIAAFVALAGGTGISWFKQLLIDRLIWTEPGTAAEGVATPQAIVDSADASGS
jgi:hypothetical protein